MQRSIWAIVPAAGIGRRMGADVPKQYLKLGERCVLEHTIGRLLSHHAVSGVIVAVATNDKRFAQLSIARQVERVDGGDERADSVLNALNQLCGQGHGDDWAMVHDAVRPCVHGDDLEQLVTHARSHEHGAILATPVRDTMKRVDNGRVTETVARDDLWHALTPQLFPANALRTALLSARRHDVVVTDEAQAMELSGRPPAVLQGRADNIKITRAGDLKLAALYLQQMETA